MRIRKFPNVAAQADVRGRSTEDLEQEYALLARHRAAGVSDPNYVLDQDNIARELERRGQ